MQEERRKVRFGYLMRQMWPRAPNNEATDNGIRYNRTRTNRQSTMKGGLGYNSHSSQIKSLFLDLGIFGYIDP